MFQGGSLTGLEGSERRCAGSESYRKFKLLQKLLTHTMNLVCLLDERT